MMDYAVKDAKNSGKNVMGSYDSPVSAEVIKDRIVESMNADLIFHQVTFDHLYEIYKRNFQLMKDIEKIDNEHISIDNQK